MFANKEWVNHGDECLLMWKPHYLPFATVWTEGDRKVTAALVQMWTDFATYGDPTPDKSPTLGDRWLPVKGGANSQHLEITADGPTLKFDSEEYKERMDFWEGVFCEETTCCVQLSEWASPFLEGPNIYKNIGTKLGIQT